MSEMELRSGFFGAGLDVEVGVRDFLRYHVRKRGGLATLAAARLAQGRRSRGTERSERQVGVFRVHKRCSSSGARKIGIPEDSFSVTHGSNTFTRAKARRSPIGSAGSSTHRRRMVPAASRVVPPCANCCLCAQREHRQRLVCRFRHVGRAQQRVTLLAAKLCASAASPPDLT